MTAKTPSRGQPPQSRHRMRDLLADIAADPHRPRVASSETADALAEVRRELGDT